MEVLLQNIRSLHNVGSIFRTSDAVGVSKIYLGGYSPSPFDRFGDIQKSFAKVALGAEKNIPFQRVRVVSKFLDQKRTEGYIIIALETAKNAVDYSEIALNYSEYDKCILILGNEKRGISKKILDLVDIIAVIPMRGFKESLNVSVAFGVAAFALRDNSKGKSRMNRGANCKTDE